MRLKHNRYIFPVEAESASLLNGLGREIEYIDLGSLGKIESSGLLKTETFTKGEDAGTCVANFKSAGDMIVFQVNASAAIENARIDVRAIYNRSSTFDASEHDIFYVNGTDEDSLVTLSGTLDNTAYGEISATGVSLQKGANYIILTCTSAEESSLGFMNVDKITITWDSEADEENEVAGTTVEEIVSGGSEVFKTENATAAADGYSLSIEAEDAGLFNSTSSSMSSTTILDTEQTTLTDDQGTSTTITNVKNFNTVGDKIVFQVYADEDIEEATISITACNGATFGGTFADNDEILTVNGGDPISLEGTLTNSAFDWKSYGTLTGTISLTKGINYIVITAASTSSTGYLNVDKIGEI